MTVDAIDLRALRRTPLPKDALAAPPGACMAKADFAVPVLDTPKEALTARLRTLALAAPRTRLIAEFPELDQVVFEQRSRLFGFPDTIRVQIVSMSDGVSAILYSCSRHGAWDMGVNRKRLRRWLARLEAAAEIG